jgi:8-oxo-dGTP pyrophosphatase MutT (NUDIX family)
MEQLYHLGVKAVITTTNNEILILKLNNGFWDLPGGRLQKGETIETTLKREIFEETGITELKNIVHLVFAPALYTIITHKEEYGVILTVYHSKLSNAYKAITLSSEHSEYKWVSKDEAIEALQHQFPQVLLEKISQL